MISWIKVLIVIGVFSSYSVGCYLYGRHSQSLIDNVAALKSDNKQLQIDAAKNEKIINDDKILIESHLAEINTINNKFNNIQKELSNAKDSINKLNVIRGNLLRYINNSITVSQVPESSTGTYAATTKYEASDFTSGIIDNNKISQIDIQQLIDLQTWIKNTTETFNK
jgi:hypothetical protein